jgi:hypothetical protein
LKFTKPDHPDYKEIEQAIEIITQVANTINERKREAENMQVVQAISAKINHKCEVCAMLVGWLVGWLVGN